MKRRTDMDTWGGYFNIIDGKNNFLLGDSCSEATAKAYVKRYQERYPHLHFEAVRVDFAHPRWFDVSLRTEPSIQETW
jgi:hypothetical protein